MSITLTESAARQITAHVTERGEGIGVRQGLSDRFRFRNPNVSGECGCGESFSVDANGGR